MRRKEDGVIDLKVIYGKDRKVLALAELPVIRTTVHGEGYWRVGEVRGPGGKPQGHLVHGDVQAAHKAKVLTKTVPRT